MIAVIVATGLNPDLKELNARYPTPMLPLVDRPFIQHVIEFLVAEGITRFEVILNHFPEKIEKFLGDGSRWGCSFTFHLAKDPAKPYGFLKTLDYGPGGEPVVVAHADRLPGISLKTYGERPQAVGFVAADAGGEKKWSGWAVAPQEWLSTVGAELDEQGFANLFAGGFGEDGTANVEVPRMLDMRTYDGVLKAHQVVMSKQFAGLMLSGKEVEEGIWISRNVSLHPTAKVLPPVYIGENCQIDGGTQLGPFAVIGHNCVVGGGCTATKAVVFPGSYVGEGLELNEVLVDKNRLVNVRMGVVVALTDQFILGGLSPKIGGNPLLALLSRLAGGVLLLLLWPIMLLTAAALRVFRKGPVLFKRRVVRLPAAADAGDWATFEQWSFCDHNEKKSARNVQKVRSGIADFLLRFIPGLLNVVRGEMRLVGVAPRTAAEIAELNEDWKELYLRAKAGLISEAFVQYGDNPSEDELFSAEVFYSAMGGFMHDLKLFFGYVERIFGRGAAAAE